MHIQPAATRAAIRATARDLTGEAPTVAAAADRIIAERLDITDPDVRASLASSTLAHVTLIAGMIGADTDPRTAVPPPETLAWAADLVRDGRTPAELLRAYRLGHAEVWAGWQRLLRPHCPDALTLDEATRTTSAFLFDYVDTVLQPLLDHHAEEAGRVSARRETMRTETLRDLLTGSAPDVPAASARLHYAIDRWHVGLVLWALPTETPERRLDRLQRAAHRIHPGALTSPGAGDTLHAWIATSEPPRLAAIPGIVIAAGRPARGLDGFRTSHDEALRALQTRRTLGVPAASVVAFADVEVVSLLQADSAAAEAFARRTLAPLGDELVTTLRALHGEGMSVSLTARRLGVHVNTIGSRVRRILHLTGETDPGSLRLRAAITLDPGTTPQHRRPPVPSSRSR